MPIYYMDETPRDSFYDRRLPNNKYRYEGYRSGIKFCIDSITERNKEQIYKYLDSCDINYLIDNEGYIINLP